MEVHEGHGAAALHHAVRGHRRIDAAGQQARHASCGAGRQAAGAALLAEEVERLVGEHLDVTRRAPGCSRSTVQPRASLMRPPISRSTCGEVSGNRLSARRADTRKLRHVRSREVAEDGGAQHLEVGRATARRARSSRCRTRDGSARSPRRGCAPGRARPRCAPSARARSSTSRSDSARRRFRTAGRGTRDGSSP